VGRRGCWAVCAESHVSLALGKEPCAESKALGKDNFNQT
jgi:hypothetical protein